MGLEPTRISPSDFESDAFTSFAISTNCSQSKTDSLPRRKHPDSNWISFRLAKGYGIRTHVTEDHSLVNSRHLRCFPSAHPRNCSSYMPIQTYDSNRHLIITKQSVGFYLWTERFYVVKCNYLTCPRGLNQIPRKHRRRLRILIFTLTQAMLTMALCSSNELLCSILRIDAFCVAVD